MQKDHVDSLYRWALNTQPGTHRRMWSFEHPCSKVKICNLTGSAQVTGEGVATSIVLAAIPICFTSVHFMAMLSQTIQYPSVHLSQLFICQSLQSNIQLFLLCVCFFVLPFLQSTPMQVSLFFYLFLLPFLRGALSNVHGSLSSQQPSEVDSAGPESSRKLHGGGEIWTWIFQIFKGPILQSPAPAVLSYCWHWVLQRFYEALAVWVPHWLRAGKTHHWSDQRSYCIHQWGFPEQRESWGGGEEEAGGWALLMILGWHNDHECVSFYTRPTDFIGIHLQECVLKISLQETWTGSGFWLIVLVQMLQISGSCASAHPSVVHKAWNSTSHEAEQIVRGPGLLAAHTGGKLTMQTCQRCSPRSLNIYSCSIFICHVQGDSLFGSAPKKPTQTNKSCSNNFLRCLMD